MTELMGFITTTIDGETDIVQINGFHYAIEWLYTFGYTNETLAEEGLFVINREDAFYTDFETLMAEFPHGWLYTYNKVTGEQSITGNPAPEPEVEQPAEPE